MAVVIAIDEQSNGEQDVRLRLGTVLNASRETNLRALAQMFLGYIGIFTIGSNGLKVRTGATYATATFTFTGLPNNGETCVVNGVTFTANTGTPGANEFKPLTSETVTAENFVSMINASTSLGIANVITASNVAGVVTLTANIPGLAGNAFTLSGSLSNATVSGAVFTGGTETGQYAT